LGGNFLKPCYVIDNNKKSKNGRSLPIIFLFFIFEVQIGSVKWRKIKTISKCKEHGAWSKEKDREIG